MQNLTLPIGTYVRATINPQQADGDPAPLDGPVTVTVLSGEVLAMLENGDLVISAPHSIPEGVAVVRVSADVRLGEGVRELAELVNVQVVEEATTFGLNFGDPQDLE